MVVCKITISDQGDMESGGEENILTHQGVRLTLSTVVLAKWNLLKALWLIHVGTYFYHLRFILLSVSGSVVELKK